MSEVQDGSVFSTSRAVVFMAVTACLSFSLVLSQSTSWEASIANCFGVNAGSSQLSCFMAYVKARASSFVIALEPVSVSVSVVPSIFPILILAKL